MEKYSAHWAATIFAAIAFHFFAALGFSYVLPYLTPEPKIENVAELEWVDVDLLPPDVSVIEAEAIPSTTAQETLPTFDAKDLVIPELTIPEPKIEPLPEIKPIEPPKPQPPPQVVKPEQKPEQKVENAEPPKEIVEPKENQQRMGRPPITIMEVYPEKGSVLGFKGYISFAARLGKDGKVKSTEILQSSGRYFVDEIARKAAVQWTFKPALDQNGRPMECDKIITFNFKKFYED
ncbi:MAG: TonB family protein [Selenomonadaceae bacterium]|nr:TonB family protein [Selenomonadaceae bacterium]